jgi:hypothetical protein
MEASYIRICLFYFSSHVFYKFKVKPAYIEIPRNLNMTRLTQTFSNLEIFHSSYPGVYEPILNENFMLDAHTKLLLDSSLHTEPYFHFSFLSSCFAFSVVG